MRRLLPLSAVLPALLLLSACQDAPAPLDGAPVDGELTVSASRLWAEPGDTLTLTASLDPSGPHATRWELPGGGGRLLEETGDVVRWVAGGDSVFAYRCAARASVERGPEAAMELGVRRGQPSWIGTARGEFDAGSYGFGFARIGWQGLAAEYDRLRLFDLTRLRAPEPVGERVGGELRAVASAGGAFWVLENAMVMRVDLARLSTLRPIAVLWTDGEEPRPATAHALAGADQRLVTSGTTVELIDVSDPENPRLLAESPRTDHWSIDLATHGENVALVCSSGDGLPSLRGLHLLSMAGDSLLETGHLFLGVGGIGSVAGVALSDRHAVVFGTDGDVSVVDVSDPSEPRTVAAILSEGWSSCAFAEDGRLLVADGRNEGLRLRAFGFDEDSQPLLLSTSGRMPGVSGATSMTVGDGLVTVCTESGPVFAWDFEDLP